MRLINCYKIKQSAKDLEKREFKSLAKYALKAQERRENLKENFRESIPPSPLEYRTAYHRDRDRILWSKAFKRLQHKTQVFPHYVEDHYKRRLTHSLEVAQIATTVARALRLNEVATEAIALGHDLGHTPFGHAGEKALNKILNFRLTDQNKNIQELQNTIHNELNNPSGDIYDNLPIPIFGFDHCVHAIEVVSRIAKEYHTETKQGGLNLTFDVRDGILKHICERAEDKEKRPYSNIPDIVKFSKYKFFGINKGSLEAQCVYFADKVTYLLGDIEDGVRSDILICKKLNRDPFFAKLNEKYKHYRKNTKEKLKLESKGDFMLFRSRAITTLILDCIYNAKKNIKKNCLEKKSVDEVLLISKRIVFLSHDLSESWKNFYKNWMVDKLFKNDRVTACSFKAEKIVTDLFNAYFEQPELINSEYYEHCEEVYKKAGISNKKLLKLILVRNYIAGMTDPFASDQHARLYMPLEHIRF